jgi:hypothetical protein
MSEIIDHGSGIIEVVGSTLTAGTIDDLFGIIFQHRCSAIIIKRECLADGFFDLSTGVAGEILQKFSNYRKRLAIVGDYADIRNKALKDFMYESNKTGQILFVGSAEEAVGIFTR